MTYLLKPGAQIPGNARLELEYVKALARDLELIINGQAPTAVELAAAPLIDNYVSATIPAPSIIGHCPDHPMLTGPLITTSDVWVFAPDLGWCRTMTRFYRLGRPLKGGVQ